MTLTSLIVALSQLQEPGRIKEVYLLQDNIPVPLTKIFSPVNRPDIVLLAGKNEAETKETS